MPRIEAAIPVNMFLDIDRFQLAIDDINHHVGDAAGSASLKAAHKIAEAVRAKLEMYPHPHEPHLKSPAPAFKGPVGMLTTGHGLHIIPGHLRDSVVVEDLSRIHSAKVYPTAVYARIQELGGWTGGSRVLYRHIHYNEFGIPIVSDPFRSESHSVYLPPRPYFRPTVMEAETIGAGELQRIYYDEWRDAMMRAVAF